ncbi:MAG TPA: SDR family NAD(P)-dependent oxidoreductase [Nocardioides sp.]|nr:SDR family NAD(P)-dependent oxidoreductase [Nocardioides sp.]
MYTSTDLTGRAVVVTGAGSGIGRELALLCAVRGADLALCDVNEEGLAATAAEARSIGRTVVTQCVDVSDSTQVREFAAKTEAEYGAVDLVANNAGIGVLGGFLDTTEADWDRLLSINLMGVVHGCRAFLPAMIASGKRGHIVNIASAAGLLANPDLGAYSATKFAVVGLSEALRVELAPHGIGVTAVCPGLINTAIARNTELRGEGNDEARRDKVAALYEKRGYTPERVARNILKAVARNKAVAPIALEAHLMYAASRFTPSLARWAAGRMAAVGK